MQVRILLQLDPTQLLRIFVLKLLSESGEFLGLR
jgi:hypothetical protein